MSSNDSMLQGRSFFASLFDFGFTSFITLRFIKIIYAIFMALSAIGAIGVLIVLAQQGAAGFLLGLIFAVVAFFFYVIFYRLLLEFVVIIFRMAENTAILVTNSQKPQQ